MRIRFVAIAAVAAAGLARAQYGMVPQIPNAPFSADIVTTQVQTLSDGTHITQLEFTTKVYRDSLGRTRTESFFVPRLPPDAQPKLQSVEIVDPVGSARYHINPEKKIAQKIALPKPRPPQTLPPAVAQALASAPPGTAVRNTPSGIVFLYNQHPLGIGDPNAPPSKTESLGTQTIEGLVSKGRRTTTTYAAGTIGNDREILVTREIWQSPEFGMMIVLTRDSDPRTGERTMRLANLNRSEPDPALFQVPPDYTIEEQPRPDPGLGN